jgi:xanthine/CO dehydrogenase XdhC/CoxF family maturation factor
MTNDELLDLARELNGRRAPYALVTVVRAIAPTSAYLGAQAIVLADGTLHGWIGGGCAKDVVIGAAQAAIAKGEPKLVRISNDGIQPDPDVEQHAMSCASNGTIELFIQPYSPTSAFACSAPRPRPTRRASWRNGSGYGLSTAQTRHPSRWSRHKARAMKTRWKARCAARPRTS